MSSDRQSPEQIAEQLAAELHHCDCNTVEYRDALTHDVVYRGKSQPPRCERFISECQAILSALREAEARALREAAERIEHTSRPLVTQQNVVEWLRQRADQLTKGQHDADRR